MSVEAFQYTDAKNNIACIFDRNPYARNQPWRCCYNSKVAQVPRPLKPCMQSSEDIRDHFVGIYDRATDAKFPMMDASPLAPVKYKAIVDSAQTTGNVRLSENNVERDEGVDCNRLPPVLLERLIQGLSMKRAQHYTSWFVGISAIFNESHWGNYPAEGLKLAHKFSKLSPEDYDARDTDNKWRSLSSMHSGPDAKLLWSWLQKDNRRLMDVLQEEVNRYFWLIMDYLRQYYKANPARFDTFEVDRYDEPYARPYDLDRFDMIVAWVYTGCGKTFQVKKLMLEQGDRFERVLILSPRQAFSQYVTAEFNRALEERGLLEPEKEFVDYIDAVSYDLSNFKRVGVQMESLHRVEYGTYDLLVMDESESLLSLLSSSETMLKLNAVSHVLEQLMRQTPKILLMDAFLSDRTLNFVKHFQLGLPVQLSINQWRPEGRIARRVFHRYMSEAKEIFVECMFTKLSEGKKLVLFMSSKRFGDYVMELFKINFGTKGLQSCFYSVDTDGKMFKDHMRRVNDVWAKLDLVIFSPKILAGLSFDVPNHFDSLFVYGWSGSCTVRDVHQAMMRVRNFKDKTMTYLLNTFGGIPPDELLDYEGVEEEEEKRAELVDRYFMKDHKKVADLLGQMKSLAVDGKYTAEQRKIGVLQLLNKINVALLPVGELPTWLKDVHVRNCLESNISVGRYAALFREYLHDAGFSHGEDIISYDPFAPRFEGLSQKTKKSEEEGSTIVELEDDAEELRYDALPTIGESEYKVLKLLRNRNEASTVELKTLYRFEFDRKFAGEPKNMAVVFDLVSMDSRLRMLLDNMHDERYMDTKNRLWASTLDNNKLMILKKQATIVEAIRALCSRLGLISSIDLDSKFSSEILGDEGVQKNINELLSLMKLYSRATSGGVKEYGGKLSMIFRAFSGARLEGVRCQGKIQHIDYMLKAGKEEGWLQMVKITCAVRGE